MYFAKGMKQQARRLIRPGTDSWPQYFTSLWEYRSLILLFGHRDLKLKYAQSVLGWFWAIIQPGAALFIYTFFFHRIIGIQTGEVPYPLFVVCGIAAWNYFNYILHSGGFSLLENNHLIRKMYFPRLILPLSKAVSGLAELLVNFIFGLAVLLWYGVLPDTGVLLLPFFILLNAFTALCLAIFLAAATIRRRDFQHLIPFLLSFGIWFTPVFYPSELLPEAIRPFMYLNPMAWVIAGYRYCLIGSEFPSWSYGFSLIPLFIIGLAGLFIFRKMESEIAEWI